MGRTLEEFSGRIWEVICKRNWIGTYRRVFGRSWEIIYERVCE